MAVRIVAQVREKVIQVREISYKGEGLYGAKLDLVPFFILNAF